MHVLYVIDSLVRGGAEQSLAALAPHLIDRGVRLEVAYLRNGPGLQEQLEASGARLHALDGPGGRIGSTRRVGSLISRQRPDLVHTTLFEADVAGRTAARLARVPVVSSLVNISYGAEHLGDPQLRRWRVRAAQAADIVTARSVVRFHAVTADVADQMARRLRISRDRIDVVWRGRNPSELGRRTAERRRNARTLLSIEDGEVLILAVARQEYQKGLDVLLEAMAIACSSNGRLRLAVAGREGNQTPMLRTEVDRLGLGGIVRFLGPRDDVADLMCAADVCVLPSRREGLPGVLLEAMAMEVPIVASQIPGVVEAVGDVEIATLVEPGKPEAIALAILELLAEPALASKRVGNGRSRFESNFTIGRSADGMVSFYGRAVAALRGPH